MVFIPTVKRYFSYISEVSFIGGVRREYQSPDKLYHMLMYLVHIAMSVIRTHNFSSDRH